MTAKQTPQTISNLSCRVHPSVVLTILDAHLRAGGRVGGALLGSITDGNVLDITDCFVVDMSFSKQDGSQDSSIFVNKSSLHTMYDLKMKVAVKETMIGWFSSEPIYDKHATDFTYWFSQESEFHPLPPLSSPLYLTLDVSLSQGELPIKASLVSEGSFHSLPLEILRYAEDSATMNLLLKARKTQRNTHVDLSLPVLCESPLQVPGTTLEQTLQLLSVVESYVDDVIEGKKAVDSDVGKLLHKALLNDSLLMSVEGFEESVWRSTKQDSDMITKAYTKLIDLVSNLDNAAVGISVDKKN